MQANKKSISFLFRPVIQEGESLASLIYRVAKCNYYETICWIANFIKTHESKINCNEVEPKGIVKFAKLTGYKIETLNTMVADSFKFIWGKVIYDKVVTKNKVKFCPLCIQKDHHHKKIWFLNPVAVCLEHSSLLQDKCPRCKNSLSMSSFISGKCICGFPYHETPYFKIEKDSLLFQSQKDLQGRLLNSNVNFLEELNFKEFLILAQKSFHLLEGLNSFLDDNQKKIQAFFRQKEREMNVSDQLILYGNVFWMYLNFPFNFYQVLDLFNKKKIEIKYEQKKQFESLFRMKKFAFIQKAYNDYWLHQVDEGKVRKDFSVFKNEQHLLEKRSCLSKDEVKEKWKTSSPRIEKICSMNSIHVKTCIRGKKKKYKIDAKTFHEVMKIQNQFISNKEASRWLGIHSDSIPKLIKEGILEINQSPTGEWLLSKSQVEKLLFQCKGAYVEGGRKGIQFYDVLVKFSVNGLSISKIIRFIQEGFLNPLTFKINGNLSDLYFDEKEIQRCLEIMRFERQKERGYYMKEAMEYLKIGEKLMRKYMKIHLLVPDDVFVLKDGRKHYFFKHQTIEQFRMKFLTVEEAALLFKISKRKIREWIKDEKLSDYTQGFCHSPLIHITEFKKIMGN